MRGVSHTSTLMMVSSIVKKRNQKIFVKRSRLHLLFFRQHLFHSLSLSLLFLLVCACRSLTYLSLSNIHSFSSNANLCTTSLELRIGLDLVCSCQVVQQKKDIISHFICIDNFMLNSILNSSNLLCRCQSQSSCTAWSNSEFGSNFYQTPQPVRLQFYKGILSQNGKSFFWIVLGTKWTVVLLFIVHRLSLLYAIIWFCHCKRYEQNFFEWTSSKFQNFRKQYWKFVGNV